MAKLTNENISLEITVNYHYVDTHRTDEYYYNLSLYCFNKPILFIPVSGSKDKITEFIDFELNDEKLSESFISALKTQSKHSIGMTYEGCFDLWVEPEDDKLDEWKITVEIQSLFYGSSRRLETVFSFYSSRESLVKFTNDLIQEEIDVIEQYEKRYGKIER